MSRCKSELLQGVKKELLSTKFIDNNTLEIKYKDGSKAIRLYNTNIITYHKNGSFILNSGGWRTPKTKDRINKYAPVNIWQKNSIWYINGNYNIKDAILFFDGIRFRADGSLISKPKKDITAKVNRVKKQIKNFVNLIDNMNKLPLPSNGDCWYCLMQTENKISLGDKIKDNSHLKQHIKEKYIHGSLLVNALREAGYNDRGIYFQLHGEYKGNVKRALTKYLQKHLLSDVL